MRSLTRRSFVQLAALSGMSLACGPVPTPTQTDSTLSMVTLANRGWTTVIESFERQHPGIRIERYAESNAPTWISTARQRRSAGQPFDLAFVQPLPALAESGLWAPIRPLLSDPLVVDDKAWRGGFDDRFLDDGKAFCFDWEHQVHHAFAVKTDLVEPGEIRSAEDLLDPKWRSRVISSEPTMGNGLLAAASLSKFHGREILEKLFVEQKPRLVSLANGSAEFAQAFARESYPIVQGLRPKPLADLRAQGLAQNVAFLDLPDADFTPSTAMLYFDGAPHPAAAKLFANWILSQDGQALLTSSLPTNSARTDVATFEPEGVGAPPNRYFEPDRPVNQAHIEETANHLRELLKTRA